VNETLRVNGRARITADPDLLARFEVNGRRPKTAIVVTVVEAFLHCSKALIRSRLWEADAKVDRKVLPSLGQMIADVVDRKASAATVAEYDQRIERSAREQLY
jgi:predicted pyridoxine 5'-phosphate oxidase superfamily flavin-nucleotide-binding protein